MNNVVRSPEVFVVLFAIIVSWSSVDNSTMTATKRKKHGVVARFLLPTKSATSVGTGDTTTVLCVIVAQKQNWFMNQYGTDLAFVAVVPALSKNGTL